MDVFSKRITNVPRSFIREILKVAQDPGMISFAGGLPNPQLFPMPELEDATTKVFKTYGSQAFQYAHTEGHLPLRKWIADRYKQNAGLDISPDDILITSGSQQALDLIGKVLINENDPVMIEEPGYLGAIQAFSVYQPKFIPVELHEGGVEIDDVKNALSQSPKLMYCVPNFQNPSGVSYSQENREQVANLIKGTNTFLIEDDPYGDLRFAGTPCDSFKKLAPENTVLLGSFSKFIVPGFRIGWIVAPKNIMQHLVTAKQATDLHTSIFNQYVFAEYLNDNDIDAHIKQIVERYGKSRAAILDAINQYFPKEVTHTTPDGGMFLWAELPKGADVMKLFDIAVKEDKVAFVPGAPFYISEGPHPSMRLSFSCVDEETIYTGIKRLGHAMHTLLD